MWDSLGQNGTPNTEIDVQRGHALEALVSGATVAAAARMAGVGRSTLNRWLNEPAFAAEVNQAKREHLAAIHAGMRGLATGAVAVVDETLKSTSVNLMYRANLALRVLKAVGAGEPERLDAGPPVATAPAEPDDLS